MASSVWIDECLLTSFVAAHDAMMAADPEDPQGQVGTHDRYYANASLCLSLVVRGACPEAA